MIAAATRFDRVGDVALVDCQRVPAGQTESEGCHL